MESGHDSILRARRDGVGDDSICRCGGADMDGWREEGGRHVSGPDALAVEKESRVGIDADFKGSGRQNLGFDGTGI